MAVSASNINVDSQNVVSFALSVGDTVKLCAPVNYPPVVFPSDAEYDPKYYFNGFIVLNQELGEFGAVPGGSNLCVYYTHNKSGRQIIQYSSEGLGQATFYAIVDAVTIHDHASIPQGGPAFATYYAELPEDVAEEGG
jgi:hypothetical protein